MERRKRRSEKEIARILQILKTYASEDLTVAELGILVKDKIKDLDMYSLRNYVVRHNIPYKQTRVIKNSSKRSTDGNTSSEKILQIAETLKSLAPYNTAVECVNIINNMFDMDISDVNYLYRIMSKYNNGMSFMTKTEFTEEQKKFIETAIASGLGKKEVFLAFSNKFKGDFKVGNFYAALSKLDIKVPKSIHIHNTTKPDVIIPIHKAEEICNEPKAWHNELTPEERYNTIIEEVNRVVERKYKLLNIQGDTHDKLGEITSALELLVGYANDTERLSKIAIDHEDVLEQYRVEVLHEIELQPFSDTDTYYQNKLKAISMLRRESKYTRDNINILKPVSAIIEQNKDVFENVLKILKQRKVQKEHQVFIPIVDVEMADKYDWCRSLSLTDTKATKPLLRTNLRNDKAAVRRAAYEQSTAAVQAANNTNKQMRAVITYRVKAEFLVLNGNPFHQEYCDVRAKNEEDAISKAKAYFDNIKGANVTQYKITDVYEINR